MNETRKLWTREYLAKRLREIDQQLQQDALMGDLPKPLRRRMQNLAGIAADLRQVIKDWPVTKNEKLRKDIGLK